MKLYATPLSHFARKVRLVFDHYGWDYDFVNVGGVTSVNMDDYLQNPLMKVPILQVDSQWIIESDHMVQYVVQKRDPADRYKVLSSDLWDLNAKAVMNGIMEEEVKIILGRRMGVPTDDYAFFQKSLKSIQQGFQWLEDQSERFQAQSPTYREFHLISLWEHVQHYDLVPLNYPRLRSIIAKLNESEIVQRSNPQNSLQKDS